MQIEKEKKLGISDILLSGYHGEKKYKYPIIPDWFPGKDPLGGLVGCFQKLIENIISVLYRQRRNLADIQVPSLFDRIRQVVYYEYLLECTLKKCHKTLEYGCNAWYIIRTNVREKGAIVWVKKQKQRKHFWRCIVPAVEMEDCLILVLKQREQWGLNVRYVGILLKFNWKNVMKVGRNAWMLITETSDGMNRRCISGIKE